MMGELSRLLNASGMILQHKIKPSQLGSLLQLIDEGTISGKIAKTVFEEMFASGKDPGDIIEEKGLVQISDVNTLMTVVAEVLASNPKSVEDFRSGRERALGFLVGQVMKATRGKANPEMVNRLLKEKLLQEKL